LSNRTIRAIAELEDLVRDAVWEKGKELRVKYENGLVQLDYSEDGEGSPLIMGVDAFEQSKVTLFDGMTVDV